MLLFELETQSVLVSQLNYSSSSLIPFVYGVFHVVVGKLL